MPRIKVLVVDDQPLLRHAVIDFLGLQKDLVVVGEAGDGSEALEKARELSPDVIVMDLAMPNMNGLQATPVFQAEFPEIKILIFTVSEKQSDLLATMGAGAGGYILKSAAPSELLRAVAHIAEGGVIVSPDMATKLLQELSLEAGAPGTAPGVAALTQREAEVLKLVAKGTSNKEIASALYISENTVKTHMSHIMEKLHLTNRRQAAVYSARA